MLAGSHLAALFALLPTLQVVTPHVPIAGMMQVRSVIVRDLGDPNQRSAFDEDAKKTCGQSIAIAEERHSDAAPSGSVIEQRPAPGQRVSCLGRVTLVRSTGPGQFPVPLLDTPVARARFETFAGRRCGPSYRLTLGSQPDPRPAGTYITQSAPRGTMVTCAVAITVTVASALPPWLMPDFIRDGASVEVADTASERCGRTLPIVTVEKYDASSKGALIDQYPAVGAALSCDSEVRLTRSLGPPPAPPSRVGDLGTEAGIAQLERVARGCPGGWHVTRDSRRSPRAKGAFDGQDPAPETIFRCGMRVTAWTSLGPASPATTMPEIGRWDAASAARWTGRLVQSCGSADAIEVTEARSDEPPGTVLSQSPAAGTAYACGDPIRLTVAVVQPPLLSRWLMVAAGILAALGVASYARRTWPWPPIPSLEVAVPEIAASPTTGGPAALPMIALEAVWAQIELSCPDGVPVASVETRNG